MLVYSTIDYYKKYSNGLDFISYNSIKDHLLYNYIDKYVCDELYNILHYFGSRITKLDIGEYKYYIDGKIVHIDYLCSMEKLVIITYTACCMNKNIGVYINCLSESNLIKFIEIFGKYNNVDMITNDNIDKCYYKGLIDEYCKIDSRK